MSDDRLSDLTEKIIEHAARLSILEQLVDKKAMNDIKEIMLDLRFKVESHLKAHEDHDNNHKQKYNVIIGPIIVGAIMLVFQMLIKLAGI